MKRSLSLILGLMITFSGLWAGLELSELENKVALQPSNARNLYELTRTYIKEDMEQKAVESWRRLADLDQELASDVFLLSNIAFFLDIEPFFPQLLSDSMAQSPRLSPDGRWIVFQAVVMGQMRIARMDFFGDHYEVITPRDIYCSMPVFAGSENEILYLRYIEGKAFEVVMQNLETNETNVVLRSDLLAQIEAPDIEARGNKLLFSYLSPDSKTMELASYNIKSSKVKDLTNNLYSDKNGRYSADGKMVTFAADNRINTDLWIMKSNGKKKKQLTDTRINEAQPDFGDNDTKLAFVAYVKDSYNIYIYDLKTEDIYPVTFSEADDLSPDLTNDGNWLIFHSDRDGPRVKPFVVSLNQPVSLETLVEEIDKKNQD